ncbi:hypothetical protein A2Y99_02220 [Candidatus Gottesmanbacteria bacterium RBG_13_37_7]|uniref:Uncharacterized protein n=1 Tax=Candidatus Gottesmanbacteria bacterium RBG_13_37_7 TaxID=1798369 RepID=A0A1F5YH36_9BACT|nr:MAG: hypothetical protein A2Y99_02220 [Candidatus Gottesmanbacteria bacterium RBG_13_37_7]
MNKKYNDIVILDENEMSYIYLLFYGHYSPDDFQKQAVRTYVADRHGFENIESFGPYTFYRDLNWVDINQALLENALYVIPDSQLAGTENIYKKIYYPDKKPALSFVVSSLVKP